MIDEGEYGVVRVVSGKHKGQVGYYDDDGGDGAIIYFSGPPAWPGTTYVVIPHANLDRASQEEADTWEAENMNDLSFARSSSLVRPSRR